MKSYKIAFDETCPKSPFWKDWEKVLGKDVRDVTLFELIPWHSAKINLDNVTPKGKAYLESRFQSMIELIKSYEKTSDLQWQNLQDFTQ